jgi:hypothetical protein
MPPKKLQIPLCFRSNSQKLQKLKADKELAEAGKKYREQAQNNNQKI